MTKPAKKSAHKGRGRPAGSLTKLVTAQEVLIKEGFHPVEALIAIWKGHDPSEVYFNDKRQRAPTISQQIAIADLMMKYTMPQVQRVEVEGEVKQRVTFEWDQPSSISHEIIDVKAEKILTDEDKCDIVAPTKDLS